MKNRCTRQGNCNSTIWFTATISDSNAAFLDGTTAPLVEYASAATTIPLDLDLWHRRLAHHHLQDVKKLWKKKLVTGMTLDSLAAPDPICEPCLAGKMHANPFPSSQWRARRPLELVHSDVHQVPYPSFSGFRYWVTFIDDYSRFRFVLPIKAKSDVFDAFKQFKAYAENQSGHRIKIMRDDKGGEYMSNAFTKFTTEWRMPLLINCGMGSNLMSLTFESGAALHMCTYRRTRELVLVHTWRIASSYATLRAIRDGSSTTLLQRRLSSQRELTLMRDTSLCLNVLHQPLSLLQVYVKGWQKRWPDWGLNPGPSGTAPGALTTELPGLGYTWSAKSLGNHWGTADVLFQQRTACCCIGGQAMESITEMSVEHHLNRQYLVP